jgi:hypothetical protein
MVHSPRAYPNSTLFKSFRKFVKIVIRQIFLRNIRDLFIIKNFKLCTRVAIRRGRNVIRILPLGYHWFANIGPKFSHLLLINLNNRLFLNNKPGRVV